jgi:hypothetical protein
MGRETLTQLRPRLDPARLPLLIFVNKGIEIATRALTLEIIADTCGPEIAHTATFIVRALLEDTREARLTPACSLAPRSRKRVRRLKCIFWYARADAKPVVKRQPTSVSVVSLSEAHAQRASDLFHQPWFRWYLTAWQLHRPGSDRRRARWGTQERVRHRRRRRGRPRL